MNEEETFEWSMYSLTDNRANDIMVWKSGRFVNGVEDKKEPEIIYQIDSETLYKLIEGCLQTGVMKKSPIVKNIFQVDFKNGFEILNDR